jgi:hypothetical protein
MEFEFGEVEDLATVPEQFRPLYGAEKNATGKFTLAPAFQPVAGAVLGLNKALGAARADAKKRPAVDLSPLAEFGTDVPTIQEKVTATIKELKDQVASNSKVNPDKIREEFAKAHQVELAKADTRNKALQGQLYKHLVESKATAEISDAKGDAVLLLPFIKNQVQVAEEDGEFKVFVVDASGDRRFSGATGQPMSLKELVGEMKVDKRFGKLFDSDAPTGGGRLPGSGRPVPSPQGEKTSTQKIAAGLANLGKRTGAKTPPGL